MAGSVLRVPAVAAVVLALATPAVYGQADTVELQFKLPRGGATVLATTVKTELNLDLGPLRQQRTAQSQARRVTRVLDVDAEGTMLIEEIAERLEITAEGKTQELIAESALVRVRPNGKVVERLIGATEIEDYPLPFPGRPVRVGESWTRQHAFSEGGIVGTLTSTLTLTGIEQGPGGRVRLEERVDGRVTEAPEFMKNLPPGVQGKISGIIRGTSKVVYEIERGRILERVAELVTDSQLEMTVQGQTISGTFKLTMTFEDRALALEDIKIPAVAPEMLISPGKNIGAIALDAPIAEITGQLGEPSQIRSSFNHRSTLLGWPNGLAGHIGAADPAKLIGLQIGTQTYRTEKGIGFGSSQGAVLFAYGMSPTRIELSDPNVGGVRMFIYNEQGIAFAITSDKAHASRGPSHAPIGGVDWITIFPAGGAAKIYPMP